MSVSVPGAELTDSHRLFLQAMMWRRICDRNEVTKIFTHSLECRKIPVPQQNEIPQALYDFVSAINTAIRIMNLRIVKCIDERTGRNHYALISGVDNSVSRLSAEYSHAELEFFKKTVECIVCSHSGYVSSTEALNLTHTMDKRIQKVDAQNIIKRFLRDKWLCQTDKGFLYLSPRCIAELDYFLTMSYGEAVVKCYLCQNTVILAIRCGLCKVKIHRHCIKKFLHEQNCCPKCHKEWKEDSSSSDEDEEEEAISFTTKGRKRAHDEQ